jgi:hypothetical protein
MQNVGEVEVERDQATAFRNARFKEELIGRTNESLREHGFNVVACLNEKMR